MKKSILLRFEGHDWELLAAMAAVEELKKQHHYITIDLVIKNTNQAEYVRNGAWFINNVYEDNVVTDALLTYDFVHTLESDSDTTYKEELNRRSTKKAHIDEQIKEISEKREIKPEEIAKPEGYDRLNPEIPPTWNVINGYACNLETHGGWKVDIKDNAYPWIYKPKKDIGNKFLHTSKAIIKTGIPYIVVEDMESFTDTVKYLDIPPTWGCIDLTKNEVSLIHTAALISNSRCKFVLGSINGATYIAWALRILSISVSNNKSESGWNICRGSNCTNLTSAAPNFIDKFNDILHKTIEKEYSITWTT